MIVKKAYNMAGQMDIPVLGIVENYSYLECPDCGKKISVFGESHIEETADEYEIPVLAKIPIDPSIASKVDEGLEPGMFYALTYTITDLARQGRPIHPDTVDAYNWVLERRG